MIHRRSSCCEEKKKKRPISITCAPWSEEKYLMLACAFFLRLDLNDKQSKRYKQN
jgi:hypothetical protein